MDVPGSPFRFGGAVDAPLLSEAEDRLYLALRNQQPYTGTLHTHAHFAAQSLHLIAERLECDAQVGRIRRHMPCRAGYGDRREEGFHVVAACVTLVTDEGAISVNAAAAGRLANRLESGLAPVEAVSRTLADCEFPQLSEAQLRALEENAAAWSHTLAAVDQAHHDSLGSQEHRDAIARADRRLGKP